MAETDQVELKKEIEEYLTAHNSMSLATVMASKPWAASVFYVHDRRLRLYFLSDEDTRHGVELSMNPSAAATINEDPDDWRTIRGIQLEGKVEKVVSVAEKARAITLYVRKFPFVKDFVTAPIKVLSHMAISGKAFPVTVYRLSPSRIFFLDNARGFSDRRELSLI